MKVIDPGHSYELAGGNGLVFRQIKDGWIVRDGTTNEEVLEVLIERVSQDCQAVPSGASLRALRLLREALAALRQRSARPAGASFQAPDRPHAPAIESAQTLPGSVVARELGALPPRPSALASAALAVCLHHRGDRRPDAGPDRQDGGDAGVGIGR